MGASRSFQEGRIGEMALCLMGLACLLNLEQGKVVNNWGRVIFYVSDVDRFWMYLREKGFNPERPKDASWGERYFHMLDPDGHELSFAQPLR